MSQANILKDAANLIRQKGWTKGALARNHLGEECEVSSASAASFSMLGAIIAVSPHPWEVRMATDRLCDALRDHGASPYATIGSYEDDEVESAKEAADLLEYAATLGPTLSI